jgi:hypothetical protein
MAEELVMVSVKMPRTLFVRLQAYAREHRYSVSELLRDGIEWRLGEEADPLAYRFGGTGNTSTGDIDLPADQEQAMRERHQEIMDLLREIHKHQRALQPAHPLPAPVGTVIPVIPPAPAVADALVSTVIPVIPPAPAVADAPPSFDTSKFYLGTLCPKGHNFDRTGMSLLRQHNQRCRECENVSKREKRAREKAEREAQPVAS